MELDDFRWMWRGQVTGCLSVDQAGLLLPVTLQRGGHDRAIVLLHGFSSSPAVFRQLLPALGHYDSVVCPLLPGHGKSINAFSKVCAKDWLTATEQICRDLTRTYQAVDVLGLSLGGLIACHLSKQFQLNHLYLLAPALAIRAPLNRTKFLAQLLYALGLRHVRNRAGNLCSRKHSELAYRKLPLTSLIELLRFIERFELDPPHCPTDLFLGKQDQVVCSKRVSALLTPLPNVSTHWLENSAHVLPLDADLKRITDCMLV